ncbi:serine carboxypeptidase S28-domain-containing protein [Gamsiella multidivaricata]|uniref:serine carboxypeptidase S28-domain-containing protein n=1 Tax=Gamsiella multidivaricata TaxID=101098 RepID=UPI00222051A4|nr:serine carboxypeptidase S28-domain-containing protein [Gamsiella multidivaricata]KAI7821399.1 serine carboxypeptidase S28-domain-containing protein [Gamsiella multidivaricata]
MTQTLSFLLLACVTLLYLAIATPQFTQASVLPRTGYRRPHHVLSYSQANKERDDNGERKPLIQDVETVPITANILRDSPKSHHLPSSKDPVRVEEPFMNQQSSTLERGHPMSIKNHHMTRSPFIKTLGLRHKSTMSWDMRARAENQAQWSTFRRQFETGRPSDRIADNEAGVAEGQHSLTEALATDGSVVVVASGDGDSEVTQNEFVEEAATEEEQDGPGNYYFRQVLDHFSGSNNLAVPKSSPLQSLLGSSNNNNTFRQYYYINSEFYKPGGPIILWIPGESPLHTLFLRRGLAYELANATSGLLVALEHRFYGSSIPRFQDSSTAANNIISDHKVRQETENNIGSRRSVWGSSSVARTHPRTTSARASDTEIKGDGDGSDGSADNTSMRNSSKGHGNKGNQEEMEGLPLDLLKYLTVDQTIEDIASFIDHFSILQPSFYPADEEDTAEMRWILAGCSYGGSLAAWARRRYPSKVFAAFASSAPSSIFHIQSNNQGG